MARPDRESERERLLKSETPLERMSFFRNELQLQAEALAALAPYRDAFAAYAKDFADFLYAQFDHFAQTKLMLRKESSPGRLLRSWEYWFRGLWTSELDDRFIHMVWHSGVLHVNMDIDQRFIDLAYGHTRRYCRDMAEREVPLPELRKVLRTVDALIDFCMLLSTDSFISSTRRCDTEVMMGVAHQMRNPLTVIGGFATLIRRRDASCATTECPSEAILQEAQRMERLVNDVGAYMDMVNLNPEFRLCSLGRLVREVLKELSPLFPRPDFAPELDFPTDNAEVRGDERCLKPMFLQIIKNSLEALDPSAPRLRIEARPSTATPGFLRVQIDNKGMPPSAASIEAFYDPFHSSKPFGTGFGLPIARLAAKKCMGSVMLQGLPDGGRYVILLALPGTAGESEFFAGG